MRVNVLGLILSACVFSISYAFVEYYIMQDTTFGYSPVLFSLLYPYHFAMAAVFGLVAYALLATHVGIKGLVPGIILTSALFASMLAVEDFMWFAFRAAAPLDGDINAGRLVTHGEWTTRFMGSTDAYFTAIPNWYFLSAAFYALALVVTRGGSRQSLAVVSAP